MLFGDTVKWKILVRYFEKPEAEYYVKELARELGVSAGSASSICRELMEDGLLKKEKKGNSLFYALKNEEPLVKRLKSSWFLEGLMEHRRCWEDAEIQAFALYGSRASGEFVSRSDVDLLVLSNADNVEERLGKLKKMYGPRLTMTRLSAAEWREMAVAKDRFYIEVLSNHILIWGSPLVVG